MLVVNTHYCFYTLDNEKVSEMFFKVDLIAILGKIFVLLRV